jgi:hypothetical protein
MSQLNRNLLHFPKTFHVDGHHRETASRTITERVYSVSHDPSLNVNRL